MKLTHYIVTVLGLALGGAAEGSSTYDEPTGSGTVWTEGVSPEGTGMMPIKMILIMAMLMT